MKLHNANGPGQCSVCKKDYPKGFVLLISDDKRQVGCGACTALPVVAKIARLSARGLRWEPHTKDKKFKCESCGSWNEPGKMKALLRIQGQQWPVCVACEQCPDLTEQDRAAIAAGMTDADKKRLEDKAAAEKARRLTDEEARDPAALRTRQGNWPRAWDALQHEREAVLEPLAAKRGIDLARLKSAFEVLAVETPAIAACTEMSLLRAYKTCLELGVYPGRGPLALAYLIPRADELTVQSGYKLYADLVLTLQGTAGLATGVAWRCEQVLGNLAAPYHAVLRAAKEASRQQRPFNPEAVTEASRVVRARGAQVLESTRQLPAPPSARDAVERAALVSALELDLLTAGMEWFEWEWFRYHAPSDLVVLDLPGPGVWDRPRFDNQRGVVPSAAWARVARRGASAVAEVVDWETVFAIAQKGGNAKANKEGGLDGSVWGDNQSCTWMWAKTALVQASTHGRLPLRAADPERMALLERLDLPEVEAQDNAPVRAYATLAEAAVARAAELRAPRSAPAPVAAPQAPQIEESPPDDYFEPVEQRELVPVEEPPAPADPPTAAPGPERAAESPLARVRRYKDLVGEDIFAEALRELRIKEKDLERFTPMDLIGLAKKLSAEIHPDAL